MMNTRDLKIAELQRLLEEDDYSLEELARISNYKPRTLAKKLLIILNTIVQEPVLSDYSYIVKIFPYLSEILQKNEHMEFDNLVPIINATHDTLHQRLHDDEDLLHQDYESRALAKQCINLIEELKIAGLYDFRNHYYGDKYSLISYLVFEQKNTSFIKEIIKSFPYLVNITDEFHEPLILNVVDAYLDELYSYTKYHSLKDIGNILYYDKVIDMIFSSPKFSIDYQLRAEILNRIRAKKKIPNTDFSDIGYSKFQSELSKLEDKISNFGKEYASVKKLAKRYGISTQFDSSALGEFSWYAKEAKPESEPNHQLLTSLCIVSIDGDNTKEIDDALSAHIEGEHIILGVHIADPCEMIPQNSQLDYEARLRTSSIYIDSEYMIPMLPSDVTEDYFSLNQGKYRYARSYFFWIEPDGSISKEKFMKSIIQVRRNLTYNQANYILNSGNSTCDADDTIFTLSAATNLLNKKMNIDHLYEEIKQREQDITGSRISGVTAAERIVEIAMTIANHRIARYANRHHMPFIYRNHTIDEETAKHLCQLKDGIQASRDTAEIKQFLEHMANLMPKAVYDTINKGHTGMGLDAYSHNTSPIRRYVDMANNYAMDEWYFRRPSNATIYSLESELSLIAQEVNEKQEPLLDFVKTYVHRRNLCKPKK